MPGCQLHNSQCSLECVAQTLSLLTPRADIDQCPQCPNPVKVQCSRHRECQASVEMSQAANQRWEESEETNEKRGKCYEHSWSQIKMLTRLSRSLCVQVCTPQISSPQTDWSESSMQPLSSQLWLTTSHIQYFSSHRAGPHHRMDSIKFYCPILPAP